MSNLLKKTIKLSNKDISFKDSLDVDQPKIRQIGENRYNIPSIKEWNNNAYSFNKTNLKHLPSSKALTDKLIKGYFNLTSFYNINSDNTSKRVRAVRKFSRKNRKSLRKIIVSDAEIKHTNEKVLVNISVLNKEKDSILRKLYLAEKDKFDTIKKFINILYGNYSTDNKSMNFKTVTSTNFSEIDSIPNNIDQRRRFIYLLLRSKNLFLKNQNKTRAVKYLRLFGVKTTRKLNMRIIKRTRKLSNLVTKQVKRSYEHPIYKLRSLNFDRFPFANKIIASLIRKKFIIRNLFFFSFLKWALWLIRIKVTITNSNKEKLLIIKGKQTNTLSVGEKTFFTNLKTINSVLLHLFITSVKASETGVLNNEIKHHNLFISLFNYYKSKKLKLFLKRYLRKQIVKLGQLYNLTLNNLKLGKHILGMESMLSKIYNKRVEVSIVNVKYAHLNSSIFAQTISIKLKKKSSSLLRVLKRSLKLVKLPKTVFTRKITNGQQFLIKGDAPFKNGFLKNYKTSRLSSTISIPNITSVINRDYIENILGNIFDTTKVNNLLLGNSSNINNTITESVIGSIKNKWVKGVRVEAKGRLTKRYTASRSVFKYKYKGNLRAENTFSSTAKKPKLSRGDIKTNMQYSLVSSKRRIGAFGIKGWISSD